MKNYTALLLCFIDWEIISQTLQLVAQGVGVAVGISALILNYKKIRSTKDEKNL